MTLSKNNYKKLNKSIENKKMIWYYNYRKPKRKSKEKGTKHEKR